MKSLRAKGGEEVRQGLLLHFKSCSFRHKAQYVFLLLALLSRGICFLHIYFAFCQS